MKYYLDFDRTIFDTPAFKRAVARRLPFKELWKQGKAAVVELFTHSETDSRRRRFMRSLGTFLSHGRFFFTPDEVNAYLYPDVPAFLAAHDCTIVTYGVEAFIRAKVASALTDLKVTDVVYTRHKKGPIIQRLTAQKENGPFTYVDDAVFQLVSVARYCPDVTILEMRRDGLPGDGRWPVVRSLLDL
ncbi:MAG TPA: hypothetical protein PK109_03515 [Candidatus Paceibacterota bacterium]|nr:hypothetical protein [Candidatus Paceibacterota bacterium]